MGYGSSGQMVEKCQTSLGVRASTQNRLQKRKEDLERELKAVTEAIELFNAHPEISDALDLLGQIQI
ncbi:MAG: hypothetical protein EHM49_01250 [Deltaproteobacteria bacterium]|nr:MAG: hypothetical protein EHM49_01250 [Deltaproteobacteria bacterium]